MILSTSLLRTLQFNDENLDPRNFLFSFWKSIKLTLGMWNQFRVHQNSMSRKIHFLLATLSFLFSWVGRVGNIMPWTLFICARYVRHLWVGKVINGHHIINVLSSSGIWSCFPTWNATPIHHLSRYQVPMTFITICIIW